MTEDINKKSHIIIAHDKKKIEKMVQQIWKLQYIQMVYNTIVYGEISTATHQYVRIRSIKIN